MLWIINYSFLIKDLKRNKVTKLWLNFLNLFYTIALFVITIQASANMNEYKSGKESSEDVNVKNQDKMKLNLLLLLLIPSLFTGLC